jgi:hypothetical protein
MSIKDSVIGTAKTLVGEIVGDGRLAEDGSREAAVGSLPHTPDTAASPDRFVPAPHQTEEPRMESSLGDENKFASLLGRAALAVWADLPRAAQERLFAAAVDDGVIANDLAEFLQDRHPRTAHPPRPTRLA